MLYGGLLKRGVRRRVSGEDRSSPPWSEGTTLKGTGCYSGTVTEIARLTVSSAEMTVPVLSETQIAILIAFWIVALIPLGATLVIFVLTKTGVVKTPIPDHYPGLIPKVVSLLVAGGWIGLRFLPGGLGAAAAVAGVWIGLVGVHWDQLLLIALSAPALTVIVCSGIIIYAGWRIEFQTGPAGTER